MLVLSKIYLTETYRMMFDQIAGYHDLTKLTKKINLHNLSTNSDLIFYSLQTILYIQSRGSLEVEDNISMWNES
jgi:hypothetical protein